jgi:hypothetical protein
MFRSKWIFSLLLMFSAPVLGAQGKPTRVHTHFIGVSYMSWKENVDLKQGNTPDQTTADLYGNTLLYQFESYSYQARSGYLMETALGTGSAGIGQGDTLAYRTSDAKWSGALLSLRYSYRLAATVATSIGPVALYRQFDLPKDAAGVEAEPASSFNYGVLAHLRLSLSKNWELNQSIGTLFQKASTFWSLGIAYKL